MKLKEIWKPIKNHEGYEISNLKNVRSIQRFILDKRGVKQSARGRLLTQYTDAFGNKKVTLSLNSTKQSYLVDVLYYQSFKVK